MESMSHDPVAGDIGSQLVDIARAGLEPSVAEDQDESNRDDSGEQRPGQSVLWRVAVSQTAAVDLPNAACWQAISVQALIFSTDEDSFRGNGRPRPPWYAHSERQPVGGRSCRWEVDTLVALWGGGQRGGCDGCDRIGHIRHMSHRIGRLPMCPAISDNAGHLQLSSASGQLRCALI
jgi:hypothetical protein